jgi:catechol 2,3-dioxygenase-like lactoylglutathione lyase family enzyme
MEDKMTEFRITGMPTVAVPVSDQDRALDFYVGELGFQKVTDVPLGQIGGRWITVGIAESPTTIALMPAREDAPAGGDTGIRLAVTDAVAAHAGLAERGVRVHELLQWDGVPTMFTFEDLDGNTFAIVEG